MCNLLVNLEIDTQVVHSLLLAIEYLKMVRRSWKTIWFNTEHEQNEEEEEAEEEKKRQPKTNISLTLWLPSQKGIEFSLNHRNLR